MVATGGLSGVWRGKIVISFFYLFEINCNIYNSSGVWRGKNSYLLVYCDLNWYFDQESGLPRYKPSLIGLISSLCIYHRLYKIIWRSYFSNSVFVTRRSSRLLMPRCFDVFCNFRFGLQKHRLIHKTTHIKLCCLSVVKNSEGFFRGEYFVIYSLLFHIRLPDFWEAVDRGALAIVTGQKIYQQKFKQASVNLYRNQFL